MEAFFEKYGYAPDKEQISKRLDIFAANIDNVMSPEILKRCMSLMDLTTLHTEDSPASVAKLVGKVNSFMNDYPGYELPASQSFLEVKVKECEMAVEAGADEIDIVLAVGAFLAGDEEGARKEIRTMRQAIDEAAAKAGRKVVFKVILETGLLVTPEKIAAASFIAMEEGADFIKTSTGKVSVNATPMAAYVMCECIKAFCAKTGRKVGFKAAGGISTARDAAGYYAIVKTVLGDEWLCKDLFRFGVSRLANALMSAIEQKTVAYF